MDNHIYLLTSIAAVHRQHSVNVTCYAQTGTKVLKFYAPITTI